MSKRSIIKALALLALTGLGNAQETVNGGMVVLGPLRSSGPQAAVDFTVAGSTAPVKSGTLAARPGTCTVGQMYFSTDALAGQSLAYCNSSGSWSVVAGSGGSGVNLQNGTSYALLDGDGGKLVSFSNASPVSVALPRAGASAQFVAGWLTDVQNRGAGSVTITPSTSTIDGAASLTLTQNQGVRIVSDGTNYFTERGIGGGASSYSGVTSDGNSGLNIAGSIQTGFGGSAGGSIVFPGSSGGTVTMQPVAVAGGTITIPNVTGNMVTTGDTGTVSTPMLGAGVVTPAKMSVAANRRTVCLVFGANNAASALADADLGPQSRQYFIPYSATVVEIEVAADGGTPNITLARKTGASAAVNLTSAALATAASGAPACSSVAGGAGIDPSLTCSATLQNTSIAAGDWITVASGSAGGTAKEMTACVTWTVN